jgi:hypothetical protein
MEGNNLVTDRRVLGRGAATGRENAGTYALTHAIGASGALRKKVLWS